MQVARVRNLGDPVVLAFLIGMSTAEAASKTLKDTEFGVRAELPLAFNETVSEQSAGPGTSQLHLGYEGEIAQAISQRLYVLGRVGTRRQYLSWTDPERAPEDAFVETRAMRLNLGLQYSFGVAPTFVVINASGGLTSSFWVARIGADLGDRKALGANGTMGVGVDHFLNAKLALSIELRGWAEQHQAESMVSEAWGFDSPGWRAGASLLVGVKLR